jgi:transposase
MTLNPNVQVKIPEHGVVVRNSGPYPAVYKVIRTYRNEKGQPAHDRVNIGKKDINTGMLIPNSKYWEYYGNQDELIILPGMNSVRHIGPSFLIGRILKDIGLADLLESILGDNRGRLAQTAALYMVARGNVFETVLDYCSMYTLNEPALSSPTASELFASITFDERMAFMKAWVKKEPPNSYLAYDVTSFSTRAKGIIEKEWGYNRDGDKLPQINLGCFVSECTKRPVFYVTYPGSIVDKSHLPYMMAYNEELRISNVCFVLDRGFCSTANLRHMTKQGLDYIMGVEKRHKATRMAIDVARANIHSMRYRTGIEDINAISTKGFFYGTRNVMHVYFDPEMAQSQKRDLDRKVEVCEEALAQLEVLSKRAFKKYKRYYNIIIRDYYSFIYKRDYNKIDFIANRLGYFCLISNTNLDSKKILTIYRNKDVIEKNFDDIKNHIDMKKLGTYTTATTEGKLFCSFISLIIISEIYNKIGGLLRDKSWSKHHLIQELEKITVLVSENGKRLMNPLTKTQRTIIEQFGLSETDLRAYVVEA